MYKKHLGFALAAMVAVALSAVAHAAPVSIEQTQLMLVVGDHATGQANIDAAPTVEFSIRSFRADVELLVKQVNSEVLDVKRPSDSAFEQMLAGVELQPVSDEIGWRNLQYSF